MGARNSTPQNVRTASTQRDLTMLVTPSVVSRMEGSKDYSQKKLQCSRCQEGLYKEGQEIPNEFSQTQDVFHKKYNEIEEYQFHKSVEKIKSIIGEPLALMAGVNEKLARLRVDLINCYNNHPKQSLICFDKAKQYEDFIFREQYKAIQKFCEFAYDNHSSTNATES